MTMKNNTKIEDELTCLFKTDVRNLTNLARALESPKKLCFNGLLVTKIYNVWAETVQRSHLSWHWRVMQNLKKKQADLWFEKWHKIFGKFSPEHLKMSNLGLWQNLFVQSRKCTSLKFIEEVCLVTMKNDAKFEEELTCHLKIGMRNLTNFDSNIRRSKKFAL